MLVSINADNPQGRLIQQMVNILEDGGVIIYPTDTVYAFACDINQKNAVEKICKLKGIKPEKGIFKSLKWIVTIFAHLL